jgi:DNA-binding transcriptional LysR family regulator
MDRLATMEAFVRVVEAGSFSGAAKQLRIGRPRRPGAKKPFLKWP